MSLNYSVKVFGVFVLVLLLLFIIIILVSFLLFFGGYKCIDCMERTCVTKSAKPLEMMIEDDPPSYESCYPVVKNISDKRNL